MAENTQTNVQQGARNTNRSSSETEVASAQTTFPTMSSIQNALFCDPVDMRPAGSKGSGVFATKNIGAGSIVLREDPLLTLGIPCETVTERDVQKAYELLSPQDKLIFDQARHNSGHGPNCKCKMGVLTGNMFGWGALVEHKTLMFPRGSRMNHSCRPNTFCWIDREHGNQLLFRAIQDIGEGQEVTFTYLADLGFLATEERTQVLAREEFHGGFRCKCTHCSLPPEDLRVSDMRRCLLRQLRFWLTREDVSLGMAPPIRFAKPEQRFFDNGAYVLLYALLLEAEDEAIAPDAFMAWALTALHVFRVAYRRGLGTIAPSTVQNMREWMKKSEDALRRQSGTDWFTNADVKWKSIYLMMRYVQDDGRLLWRELSTLKSWFWNEKGLDIFSGQAL